jgi:uracil-DNA glycosylase
LDNLLVGRPEAPPEAPYDCPLCPRLAAFRHQQRQAHADWFNGPVASFGDPAARLLVVGLAPGLKGANRTGRPFTGDFAGHLLYETLGAFGFATGSYRADPHDGLELTTAWSPTRCAACRPATSPWAAKSPPATASSTPASPRCRSFAPSWRWAALHTRRRVPRSASRPGTPRSPTRPSTAPGPLRLFDSYHCSRLNTNTGRLTRPMFEAVFAAAAQYLEQLETANPA